MYASYSAELLKLMCVSRCKVGRSTSPQQSFVCSERHGSLAQEQCHFFQHMRGYLCPALHGAMYIGIVFCVAQLRHMLGQGIMFGGSELKS